MKIQVHQNEQCLEKNPLWLFWQENYYKTHLDDLLRFDLSDCMRCLNISSLYTKNQIATIILTDFLQFWSHFEGKTSGNIEFFRLPVSMPHLRHFAIMEICNWPYTLYLKFILELGIGCRAPLWWSCDQKKERENVTTSSLWFHQAPGFFAFISSWICDAM